MAEASNGQHTGGFTINRGAAPSRPVGNPQVDQGVDPVRSADLQFNPETGDIAIMAKFDPAAVYKRPWSKKLGRFSFLRVLIDTGYKGVDIGDGYRLEFRLTKATGESAAAQGRTTLNRT